MEKSLSISASAPIPIFGWRAVRRAPMASRFLSAAYTGIPSESDRTVERGATSRSQTQADGGVPACGA